MPDNRLREQCEWLLAEYFLVAGQSAMRDVAARMGESTSYAGTYRERLLRQGIIGEPDRNAVGFDLPGFKEYPVERLGN